ncbi:MAG: hypothetical protein EHM83_02410, partial [Burkholderiales bacterium]
MQHLHELATLFDPATVALIVEPGEPPDWIAALARQLDDAKVRAWRIVLGEPAAERPQAGCDLAVIAVGTACEAEALRAAA